MTRLVDYFTVVGYSEEKLHQGADGCGVLLQRFPAQDWEDEAFIDKLEVFWQPLGWNLSTEKKEPSFFMCVLTDTYGTRRYCACLSFHEPYTLSQTKPVDEDEEIVDCGGESMNKPFQYKGELYAPRVLCIISRLNFTETFRFCLGTIYSSFIDKSLTRLETLIGHLLSQVNVPPPGGPQFRFSIGGGDLQIIQPPMSPNIPVTGTSVALLVQQIGINNLLRLFSAAMTEQKILFYSRSSSRLYEACGALVALMFPFKWLHTYIPLLPATLVEVVETPTPFMIGLLAQAYSRITEKLSDVIQVDLDGGSLIFPENPPKGASSDLIVEKTVTERVFKSSNKKNGRRSGKSLPTETETHYTERREMEAEEESWLVPRLPKSLSKQVLDLLTEVLHPELASCDHAFPPLADKPSNAFQLDKDVRAVFMRLLAQLFQGYRPCLLIIRIHPAPVIRFHKAKFLGGRGLSDNSFVVDVLNSQGFSVFVTERGSPYRPIDIWDEIYANFGDQVEQEERDKKLVTQHLLEIASQLVQNECPNSLPYAPKVVKAPDWQKAKTNMSLWPMLDEELVEETIRDGLSKQLHRYNSLAKINQSKVVPFGSKVICPLDQSLPVINNSARRLEVVRNCINCIFENKISGASKSIHAVKKALTSPSAKLVLCEELKRHVNANVAMLERQQFDMVVLLMQCALQGISETDEEGVAAALLPLATSFCRKLCTGVIQFAYTCIQEHPVWRNQNFWECTFYTDVQKDIVSLYSSRAESSLPIYNNNHSGISLYDRQKELKGLEITALDIAAEHLRIAPALEAEKLRELGVSDESTLYSQAIHHANRMVFLLTPMDAPPKKAKEKRDLNHVNLHHIQDNVSSIASVAESDSVGGESAFEDHDCAQGTGIVVTKLVTRFVDKVCGEGGVTEEHLRSLNAMIPSVVEIHLESMEGVSRESKRLPPVLKPRIPNPQFLPGEELLLDSIRVVLLPDGRELGESLGGIGSETPSNINKSPLPAEGALFLSNYRLIFKGSPSDQTMATLIVIRSFPITTLMKEKRISVSELGHKDQEGALIRSATAQLLRLAFDEEVGGETIESFRKTLHRLRFPPDIFQYFAFVGQTIPPGSPFHAHKDKNTTLKVFAKKTLLMTAKKVGVKPKQNSKKQKYVLRSWAQGSGGTLPPSTKYLPPQPIRSSPPSKDGLDGDEISLSDEDLPVQSALATTLSAPSSDAKTMERILERGYVKDWKRLGLANQSRTTTSSALSIINKAESMRFSLVNCTYGLCPTYPALIVVPQGINDESLKKLAHSYNSGRLPVVSWKHPSTRALLLRGAAMNSKGIGVRVFGAQKNQGGGSSEGGSGLEQENFIRAIVQATPGQSMRPGSVLAFCESTQSIDSLLTMASFNIDNSTPDVPRKGSNPFQKAMDTLRTSGGKAMPSYKSWTAARTKRSQGKVPPTQAATQFKMKVHEREVIGSGESGRRVSLYIFMEKSKLKTLKGDSGSKVEYIPVSQCPELGKVRASFKQVLRASAPSGLLTKPEEQFLRAFELSDWLLHLQTLLRLSGAVLDLLDSQGSSVMLCLGDGADLTSQISSLAQLCLDPFYRTMEGFNVLLEKEWLAFGHKFSERNNMTGLDGHKSKDLITPIFIQFLDVVHQIMKQFPISFQFNHMYLKFLAYHSISARFRTFLLDSEYERVSYGFMALDDKRGSLPRHYKGVDGGSDDETLYMGRPPGSNSHQNSLGQSIFEYIDKVNAKSPLFYNLAYERDTEILVLRPVAEMSNLEPWEYFVEEWLGLGSPYDLEVGNPEESSLEEKADEDLLEKKRKDSKERDTRRILFAGVDLLDRGIPDAITFALTHIHRLELEKCLLPQGWKQRWDRLQALPLETQTQTFRRFRSLSSSWVTRATLAAHHKATLEILRQGKLRSSDLSALSSHAFDKKPFTTLHPCTICSGILLGKVGLECGVCGLTCHERCSDGVPKCGGLSNVNLISSEGGIPPGGYEPSNDIPSITLQRPESYYQKFQSPVTEDRTYEGYLFKRGALLKGWRQRWFVLDSTKHQLRYYEAMDDSQSKGFIDLSEVKRVGKPEQPLIGSTQRKGEDNCVFEIKTCKRVISFAAADPDTAMEWIEKIQACLI